MKLSTVGVRQKRQREGLRMRDIVYTLVWVRFEQELEHEKTIRGYSRDFELGAHS